MSLTSNDSTEGGICYVYNTLKACFTVPVDRAIPIQNKNHIHFSTPCIHATHIYVHLSRRNSFTASQHGSAVLCCVVLFWNETHQFHCATLDQDRFDIFRQTEALLTECSTHLSQFVWCSSHIWTWFYVRCAFFAKSVYSTQINKLIGYESLFIFMSEGVLKVQSFFCLCEYLKKVFLWV